MVSAGWQAQIRGRMKEFLVFLGAQSGAPGGPRQTIGPIFSGHYAGTTTSLLIRTRL